MARMMGVGGPRWNAGAGPVAPVSSSGLIPSAMGGQVRDLRMQSGQVLVTLQSPGQGVMV